MAKAVRLRNAPRSPPGKSCAKRLLGVFLLVAGAKFGPGSGIHVAQVGSLPAVFRVRGEKRLCEKIGAAGMTHARDEAHLLRHGGVGGFGLNGAAGIKRSPSP